MRVDPLAGCLFDESLALGENCQISKSQKIHL